MTRVLNQVVIAGRLVRAPELRYTQQGQAVTTLTLAVGQALLKLDKEIGTAYFDVVAFGKLAESIAEHLEKGQEVVVAGRLQVREWETQKGKGKKTEIIATLVQFGRKAASPEGEGVET